MYWPKATIRRLLRSELYIILGVTGLFLLFKQPVLKSVYWILSKSMGIDVDALFNLMLAVFLICSCLLVSIVYWLARENAHLKAFYNNYISKLVAKDYYKGAHPIDFDEFISNLATQSDRKREDEVADKNVAVPGAVVDKTRPAHAPNFSDDQPFGHLSDGLHRVFFPNGKVAKEATFRNGLPDGVYRTFYEDGRPHQIRDYKEGQLHGIFRAYDENGILFFEIEYKNGKQHGQDKIYYKSGILQYLDTYVNGERVNRKTYSERGELLFDQDFQKGYRGRDY